MTAVDVLAVFDRAKEWVDCDLSICDDENRPDELRHGLTEARAAVAELIAAAQQAREVLGTIYGKYQVRIGPYATRANTADWALHAALARAQGGAE